MLGMIGKSSLVLFIILERSINPEKVFRTLNTTKSASSHNTAYCTASQDSAARFIAMV